ncbi:hypothetical protein [Glycomyces albidus]|uniref:Uncharacterized protein n=1 Tax=Glycomyces albidus TaxID=2656774 RepID=A0A6L5G5C9_9ACTN|nr:hypothetical protein [Glycomyces albidus]MQM24830.1 hypothetical protein [Glycomyces albidus]
MPTDDTTAAIRELRDQLTARKPGEPPPKVLAFPERTDLLRDFHDKLRRRAPVALINCQEFTEDPVPDLLTEIKRQLMQRCEPYPRLQFRRLEFALAVIEQSINFRNHRAAQRQIKQAAKSTFAPNPVSNTAVAEGGAVLGQVAPGAGGIPALLAGLYQARFPTLYSFYKWFGHRDIGALDEPLDYLANLNLWAHPRVTGPARDVELRRRDRALIAAFLGDLRFAYGRGRLAKQQWYSCVALLRNADAHAGRSFVARLTEVTDRLDRAEVDPAPFLAVTDGEPLEPAPDDHPREERPR